MPIVFSEGVGKGRISLQTMVATHVHQPGPHVRHVPARRAAIAVGSDADIVLIDPKKRVTLSPPPRSTSTPTTAPSRGWRCTGYPVLTLSRGEVIAENGRYVGGKARGRYIKRGPYQAP